jgi:hypothetical protein
MRSIHDHFITMPFGKPGLEYLRLVSWIIPSYSGLFTYVKWFGHSNLLWQSLVFSRRVFSLCAVGISLADRRESHPSQRRGPIGPDILGGERNDFESSSCRTFIVITT